MTFQLPSSKLRTLIKKIRTEETEERVKAFDKTINQIEDSAQTDACSRCQNAEWGLFWDSKRSHWQYPVLLACRAGMSLPANQEGFGLQIPDYFFCTAENNSSSNPIQTPDSGAEAQSKSHGTRSLSATEVMAEAIKLRRQAQRP